MKIVSNFPHQIVMVLFILAIAISFMSSNAASNVDPSGSIGCHLGTSSFGAYYGAIKVEIENLQYISLSVDRLAVDLTSTLTGEDLTFSLIQSEVGPVLFEALTTKTRAQLKPVQASFIGINGVFLSYFTSGEGITSIYSNATFSSSSYTSWFTQPISDDGNFIGEALIVDPPTPAMYDDFLEAMNVTNGYTSIGRKWCEGGSEDEIHVMHSVVFDRLHGAISLGFPIEEVMGFVSERFNGGDDEKMMMVSGVRGDRNANYVFEDKQYSAEDYVEVDPKPFVWNKVLYKVNASAGTYSLVDMIGKHRGEILLLSIATTVAFSVFALSSAYFAVKLARREAGFKAQLSKQKEATQEAEKQVMHKNAAVATVSHDIRGALSGISGLIGQSYCETVPGSDLEVNLRQMETSVKDLLDLLNDILDASKIMAGKMELAEAEFDLASLLEDIVDLYHPVGMKKGVDVMLDPCDGSLYRYSAVKGDYLKLKQVISNLLSNAVKFTTEGHISLRVWASRHVSEDSTMTNSRTVDSDSDDEESFDVKKGRNCVEFVFEVDDTGKGIPKDKRKSVFENYVQVKETAAVIGGGTGLGLGIVQSLVRLMGGKIEIADKPVGETGSCFKFNIFLTCCEDHTEDGEFIINPLPNEADSSPALPARSCLVSNDRKVSLVVLLIQNEGRRRMIQSFLESVGIVVLEAKEAKDLPSILEEANRNAKIGFVLLIVDASVGEFSELKDCVARSRKNCSKLVWLETRKSRNPPSRGSDVGEESAPLADYVTSKPLHGSRFFEVIRTLPEFKHLDDSSGDEESEAAEEVHVSPTRTSENKGASEQKESPIGSSSSSNAPLVGKRVLIAEDNLVLMLVACRILTKMGAIVEKCKNGQEAVELVRKALKDQLPYDCILMDCEMPVMNGFEATRMIRKEEKEYDLHTPIFALTAHSADGDKLDGMFEAGMDLYLQKPLQEMQLVEAIRSNEKGKSE